MKLLLRNIAKVHEAEIKLDGVTVIVGKNNTGKSTVGKSLFCLFHALGSVEKKINEQKARHTLEEIMQFVLTRSSKTSSQDSQHTERRLLRLGASHKMLEDILELYNNKKEITARQVCEIIFRMTHPDLKDTELPEITDEDVLGAAGIADYLNTSDEEVIRDIVSETFKQSFDSQVNSRNAPGVEGVIHAQIKGYDIKCSFVDDDCSSVETGLQLTNQAIFLDNPSLLDRLNASRFDYALPLWERLILEKIRISQDSKPEEGAVARVRSKNKLLSIYKVIDSAIAGSIVTSEGKLAFKEAGNSYSINLANLSYGVKTFVILKMLLERNILSPRDVLILDEPEIHLHPDWQILLAHAVVLLQKEFDLTVLVTTHSHFFVDAVDLFTRKYNRSDKAHFYVASQIQNSASFRGVEGDLDAVYDEMSSTVDQLDRIRNSLP